MPRLPAPPGPPPNLRAFRWQAPALLALLLLAYVPTLLPGVGYHPDTARFQLAGKILGITHPTGFPLYLLLDKLWVEALPFGSVAWRVNLLSAVLSTLAGVVLLRLLLDLCGRPAPAFSAALAFGLTRTLWSQSIVAEVYTLNLLFLGLVLLFFLRWGRSGSFPDFAWATALYALSFGNHLVMVTLLPALAWWVWRCDRRAFVEPRKIAWVLPWIALGASLYGYLLWRSLDPDTPFLEHRIPDLGRLLWFVTGGPARGQMFAFSPGEMLHERLPLVAGLLAREWSVLLAVCALGVAALGRRRENAFLLLAAAGPLVFASGYAIPDVFVYFLPVHFVLAIYLGLGLDRLTGPWPRPFRAAALLAVPAVLAAVNRPAVDQSGNRARAREIEAALATAGHDAVLLAPSRAYSRLIYYYLLVEGWEERHLSVSWSPEGAIAYLTRGTPLDLPERRRRVPPGRPVYAMGEAQGRALAAAGLPSIEIRRGDLVLHLAAADPRARAAALAELPGRAPGATMRFEPEASRLTIFEPDPLPPPAGLARGPVTVECALEEVEGRGAWRKPLAVARGDGLLAVRGWALDRGRPALGVWAVLDGRPVAAAYGRRRRPGPTDDDCRGCDAAGFEALVPLGGIPAGRHRLEAWVLARAGTEIRPCARRVWLDLR